MKELLSSYELTNIQWVLVMLCGMLIGLSKTGVSGVGLAVVPILAAIFGGRPSTGLLLPMLIMADVFAVKYYNRHAEWKHVFRLMPWALAGIGIALYVGQISSIEEFRIILSVCIFGGIVLMLWKDTKGQNNKIPDYWWFSAIIGLIGGFTTMIGNAAGPIMALYLLSMRLPKNNFIGTAAWFFLIINIIKMPLHIFFWETINLNTVVFDLAVLPAIIVGVVLGILVVKKIPERFYRILVIVTTVIAAFVMFFK